MRLSHKYGIENLKDQALGCLKAAFTTRFPDCQCVLNYILDHPLLEFSICDAIAVIQLGRLTDTTSVLGFAFFLCTYLPPEFIAEGFTRDGHTTEYCSLATTELFGTA
ncbi:hypothetical protein OBBRIDRAFT_316186 [Obba rivulosa]|uniref:Uncharacterized protein n=1 Tax=Obba rivulosa TaxID=1052685 RepID=A0A8E2DK33_9APHY|nr:hypothetical protein OBBRIDRAFT_316186 [Obba rivulosa]